MDKRYPQDTATEYKACSGLCSCLKCNLNTACHEHGHGRLWVFQGLKFTVANVQFVTGLRTFAPKKIT